MQIFGLHRNIYRLERYGRTQELWEALAKERQKVLGDWEFLKARLVPEAQIAKITGVSRSTYYRRKKALSTYGLQGLKNRSRRPRKVRQSKIPDAVRQLILKLRQENPTYGKAKLTVLLRRDHGVKLSESSVGRVLGRFMRDGIVKRYAASPHAKARKKRRAHATRLHYGTKAQKPGELIQMDHMTVTKNGKSFKHFQAICPITKVLVAQIYSNATSKSAESFLSYVQEQLPFPICSIQVDGGSEFKKHFEAKCQLEGIPLFELPPKQPQWNGNVERANRTFREELYDRKDLVGENIIELRIPLKSAVHKYNTYRPHQRLNGLTPWQYTQSILETKQSHML